jgi:hypothetical protein
MQKELGQAWKELGQALHGRRGENACNKPQRMSMFRSGFVMPERTWTRKNLRKEKELGQALHGTPA